MRILMLAIHFPVEIDNIQGGVHSAISNLLKGFASYDIRVRLVTFNNEVQKEKVVALTENIDIVYCPEGPYPFHSMNYLLKCGSQVKKQIKKYKPDLIHYEAGDTFFFTKLFGLNKIKHLQTVHGIAMAEGKVNKNFKSKMTSYFNGMMEKLLFPKNIIHLSQYSKRTYEDKKLDNYAIIPNAVTEKYFALPVKEKTSNRLLYVGGIDRNKNIPFLLQGLNEMVKRNKSYQLHVLGGFKDPEFKKEIEIYVEENKLFQYITFHGWVPQSKVISIVAASDILVVSSKQESLPMVIAECMAAGKLVLASTVGGIPEMVIDGESGYLTDIKNLDSLVSRLDELYNNTDKVRAMSIKAKALANENYHCENVAKKTIAFYNTVVGNKHESNIVNKV
ncbi:MAG: glycosyltransferase family 4 protein [Ferruginibacter sp.]